MEWLLFTYWLPPDPSRKRVFTWRQLKKIGALSTEGGGWLLPRTDELSANIAEIARAVEEMGGTTNLYVVTHFTEAQEQRAIARFSEEREKEYSGIITECHKALKHIERETQKREFNFEEVEELEGDLGKIKRWYTEVKKRDFWEVAVRMEIEKSIGEVEDSLATFIQKTYEVTAQPDEGNDTS